MTKNSAPDSEQPRREGSVPSTRKPQPTLTPDRKLAEEIAASMGMLPIMQDSRLERRQDRFEKNLTENRGDATELQDTQSEEPNQ